MSPNYTNRPRSDERRYPNGERMPEDAAASFEPEAPRPRKGCGMSHSDSVVGAIVLMSIGTVFFLSNLGLVRFHRIWQFWPIVFIAVGIGNIIKGRPTGFLFAIGGGIAILANLGLLHFSIWTLWPLILVGVGLSMLAKPWAKADGLSFLRKGDADDEFTGSDNRLQEWTLFGGVKRIVNSPDFQGGQLVSVFGGIEIDLRRAQVAPRPTPVVIEANAVFGGVSIKVPDTWRVAVRGVGIFGGYVDETLRSQHPNPAAPLLVVTGYAAFGGVVVE